MKTAPQSPRVLRRNLLAVGLFTLAVLGTSEPSSATIVPGPVKIGIDDLLSQVAYGSITDGTPAFANGEFYSNGIRVGGEQNYAAAFMFDISAFAGGELENAYFSIFQTDITLGMHELTLEVYGFDPGAGWTETTFSSTDLSLIEIRSYFGGNGSNRDFDVLGALQLALDANFSHVGFRLTNGLTLTDSGAYIDFASTSPELNFTLIPEPSAMALSIALLPVGVLLARIRRRAVRSNDSI